MIAMSACLAGKNCKYNGGNNEIPELKELFEKGEAVLVCPEVQGGLPVPRLPSEISENKVYNTAGEDVTDAFIQGSRKALALVKEHQCELAILKANSPSCGTDHVYDGAFTHTLRVGCGIFTAMCRQSGIVCLNETEYMERQKQQL